MAQSLPGLGDGRQQLEKCLFINAEVELPITLLEDVNVFMEVMSLNTWQTELSDNQKRHLIQFLPSFPKSDMQEKQVTLRKVFAGENVKFGTPLRQFHSRLKEGQYSPDIVRYIALCRKAKLREYRYQQQVYYSNLLKDILVNRQRILAQAYQTPINEPLQLKITQYITNKEPAREKPQGLQQRVQCRYAKILKEVNEECGADTSDEEEVAASSESKSVKPVCRPLFPESPPETASSGILPTFGPKPSTTATPVAANGQPSAGLSTVKRPRSPIEITEDDYRQLVRKHRKRKTDGELHPELDTSMLTLQDILSRAMPSKRALVSSSSANSSKVTAITSAAGSAAAGVALSTTGPTLLKKKLKEKSEKKKKKMKIKEETGDVAAETPVTEVPVMDANSVAVLAMATSTTPANPTAVMKQEVVKQEEMVAMETTSMVEVKDETDALQPSIVSHKPAVPSNQQVNFFSLLRDFICEEQDGKTTTTKLEERVRDWQENTGKLSVHWFGEQSNWAELVAPALKFLSGDVLGLMIENFIPLLDYKERAQQWKWIGRGRDADDQLLPLYRHWSANKEEVGKETQDGHMASPPAPKMRTTFVVRPTNDEEKSLFQKQEFQRFSQPHKAFTYQLHGYSSVVGPVKGVYAKESTMNKARDHVLLVKDRPPYVTILTLVRDAAARLPNGEGTRGDICELLKDSQFLAEGVTDAQINNVVSGALDRLHYEKDPCVKYDVNRKLWIYLHRNRTEDEFERIHQAQGAAAKAKKALQKPKPTKKIKESVQAAAGATSVVPPPDSPLKIEPPSPGGASVSPRAQMVSPRTPQMSPRTPTQASPKQPTQPKLQQASPKLTITTTSPLATSPRSVTTSSPTSTGKVTATTTAAATSLVATTLAKAGAAQAAATTTTKATAAALTPTQTVVSLHQAINQGQVTAVTATAAASTQATTPTAAVVTTVASAVPLTLAQQLGVGKAGAAGVAMLGSGATAKPVSLAFLQQHVAAAAANKGVAAATTQSPGTPPVGGAAASKPLTFSLIQSPVGAKVTESATGHQGQTQGQTRTVVLTSKGETIGQKLLLTQQQHQQLQQQQHLQQLQQQIQQQAAASGSAARPMLSSPKLQKAAGKPSTTSASASPMTLVTTAVKGCSTKVVQQVASSGGKPQMVSVSNVGLASVASLQKQAGGKPTTIKIQGGSILQSSSSKPLTIQRMAALEGAEVKGGQVILQRSPSVEVTTSDGAGSTNVLQPQVAPGSPQLVSRPGGKPATLVFTKPGNTVTGKPQTSGGNVVTSVSGSLAAHLLQNTSIGGRPIIIGGKPVHLSGKPIQIGGKPVHLIGKPGGGQIGVIQGQGGVMSAVNIVTQATTGASTVASLASVPQARLITTPTATAPTLVGQILQSSTGAVAQAGRATGATTTSTSKTAQAKMTASSSAGGVVVSQLATENQSKAATTGSQHKVVTAAGQGVLGHQILVAPGSGSAKVVNAQQLLAATGSVRPGLLTRSPGGKPGPNIQVVKTMLSQASGGKPGQTTIVLAQPGGQQVTVAGMEQLTQQAGVKTVPTTAKSKGGPVYARIITPPPGIRLAAVRSGSPAVIPGVSMLQAVGARLHTSDARLHTSDGQMVTSAAAVNAAAVAAAAASPTATSKAGSSGVNSSISNTQS